MLTTLLCLLPVLAVVLPLLARRYPGERVLVARHGETQPHWPRPRASVPSHRSLSAFAPRGGLLLACGLAVRPPPLAAF